MILHAHDTGWRLLISLWRRIGGAPGAGFGFPGRRPDGRPSWAFSPAPPWAGVRGQSRIRAQRGRTPGTNAWVRATWRVVYQRRRERGG